LTTRLLLKSSSRRLKTKKSTSKQRIEEALVLGDMQYFITACPKDYTMHTDAVKTSGTEGKIGVKDMIELVAEAVEFDN